MNFLFLFYFISSAQGTSLLECLVGGVVDLEHSKSIEKIEEILTQIKRKTHDDASFYRTLEGKTVRLDDGKTQTLGKHLGNGANGIVYCLEPDCKKVIKIAKTKESKQNLLEEQVSNDFLKKKGRPYAEIHEVGKNGNYLIKDYIQGPHANELERLSKKQIDDLLDLYRSTSNYSLDISPENFIWSDDHWVAIDSLYVQGSKKPTKEYLKYLDFFNFDQKLESNEFILRALGSKTKIPRVKDNTLEALEEDFEEAMSLLSNESSTLTKTIELPSGLQIPILIETNKKRTRTFIANKFNIFVGKNHREIFIEYAGPFFIDAMKKRKGKKSLLKFLLFTMEKLSIKQFKSNVILNIIKK
ncbi:MAG: hypothetical protein CL678_11100 [Bdellovibrionaceae bacterium]|nr:hypothetical protein [Pseudobdellovibrionaceae bacterium]